MTNRLAGTALCAIGTAFIAGTAGCSFANDDPDRFREAIPQASEVEVSGPDGSEQAQTGASASTAGSGAEPWATGPWAKYYGFTRHVRTGVNAVTAVILGGAWIIVHTEPSDVGDHEATWGPYSDALSPVSWRFRVTEVGAHEYDYFLEGRPKASSSDGDYRAVLSGKGYGRRHDKHGDGTFSVDLDTARELDPFEHGDDSGVLTITHRLSTPELNVTAEMRPSAAESWWTASSTRHADGTGSLLVTALDDADDSGTTALEDISIDSKWRADGVGRADITLTGGDVGPAVVTAVECWDTDFMRSYYSDSVAWEPTEGEESACGL